MEVYRVPNTFTFTNEYIEALKQSNDLKKTQARILELEQQLSDYHNTLESKLSKRNERIIDLEGQVNHWKSNHDNMQQKNAILRQRPDLPIDRIPACAFIDDAKAKINALEQQLADLQAKIDGGFRVRATIMGKMKLCRTTFVPTVLTEN